MFRKRDRRIRQWKKIIGLNKVIGNTRGGEACSIVADFVTESSWDKHCPLIGVCGQLYTGRVL